MSEKIFSRRNRNPFSKAWVCNVKGIHPDEKIINVGIFKVELFVTYSRLVEPKDFSLVFLTEASVIFSIFYDFQNLHVLQPNFCHEIVEKSGPLVIYLKIQ